MDMIHLCLLINILLDTRVVFLSDLQTFLNLIIMRFGRPSWKLTAILFIQKNKIVKNEFIDLKNIILDGQIVLQIDHQTEILNVSVWTLFWPPSWISTTILFLHNTKNAGNEFLDLTNVILDTRIMFLSDLQAEILQFIFWTPSWTPSWISDEAPVRFWPILSKMNRDCILNISCNFQLAPNFFWVTTLIWLGYLSKDSLESR